MYNKQIVADALEKILIELLQEDKNKKPIFSDEKAKIVKIARAKAEVLSKIVDGKYDEDDEFGSLTLKVQAPLYMLGSKNIAEFKYLVANADEISILEGYDGDIIVEFVFKSDI